MKKTLLGVLLGLNLLHAEIIPTNTTFTSYSYTENMNNNFYMGDVRSSCKNNVVYYIGGTYENPTMSTSYNPDTKEPYYCSLGELIEVASDDEEHPYFSRYERFKQEVTILHSSYEI